MQASSVVASHPTSSILGYQATLMSVCWQHTALALLFMIISSDIDGHHEGLG
jgi:hypothetical protein